MKNPFETSVYLKRTTQREEDIRGAYFRDQTAIIHSLPFRRLKHKTQVFFAPKDDHICTRIEHVLHVATIAATICKGLNVNGWKLDLEMAYAIGLGHDLGHAPFGHDGEHVLNKRLGGNNAFIHEINGYRVVEHIANKGKGLNLTYGVKDGIICHNGENFEQYLKPVRHVNNLEKIKNRNCIPGSYEGCIVRFADKIAYLGRDIEDAIITGLISKEDVPAKIRSAMGVSNREIINELILDLVDNSKNSDEIGLSDKKFELIKQLRDFNYSAIYLSGKRRIYEHYAEKIINNLFDYLLELYEKNGKNYPKYEERTIHLDRIFGKYLLQMHDFYEHEKNTDIIITDFVAGMTDLFALDSIKEITIPPPIFCA